MLALAPIGILNAGPLLDFIGGICYHPCRSEYQHKNIDSDK